MKTEGEGEYPFAIITESASNGYSADIKLHDEADSLAFAKSPNREKILDHVREFAMHCISREFNMPEETETMLLLRSENPFHETLMVIFTTVRR